MAQINIAVAISGVDQGANSLISAVQGGLGTLGNIAQNAVSFALGGVLTDAFHAATDAAAGFFKEALGAEKQQTMLANSVRLANEGITESNIAAAASRDVYTTSTVGSAKEIANLTAEVAKHEQTLAVATLRYQEAKHHTGSQTLAYQQQVQALDDLKAKLAAAETTVTSVTKANNALQDSFSVGQLNAWGDQFRDLYGGSDEAVTAIEQIGLQAGSVSANEMPQFIQRVADLGAVMGDTSAAALLEARALEDPVKAMTTANRAGIIFDLTLKEQIKTLVKHGDAAAATKLVLDRIAEATSGAAAASLDNLSGRWEILTNHLEDAGKGIMLMLMPTVEKLFDTYIKPNIPVVENMASAIGDFLSALTSGDIGGIETALGKLFGDILTPEAKTHVDNIVFGISKLFDALGKGDVGTAMTSLGSIVDNLETFAPKPVVDFIETIKKRWPEVSTAINVGWAQIRLDANVAGSWFQANVIDKFNSYRSWFIANWPAISDKLLVVWAQIRLDANVAWSWFDANVMTKFKDARTWFIVNWPTIKETMNTTWTGIKTDANTKFVPWWNTTLLPLFKALGDDINANATLFTTIFTPALKDFNAAAGPTHDVLKLIGDFLDYNLTTTLKIITGLIQGLTSAMQALAKATWDTNAAMQELARKGNIQPTTPTVPSTWGPGNAGGADFIVPPGFPNDSFPMRVQSGERVQVTPAGQSAGGNLTINVDARGSTLSRAQIKAAVAQALSEAGYKADTRMRMGAT